jgi:transposase
MAAAAMERSINANLLRRWVLEAERQERSGSTAKALSLVDDSFIALPAPSKSLEGLIQIEVRRGALSVIVQWPASAMPQCALWLRELLK